MNYRILSPVFGLLLSLLSFNLSAQGFGVRVDSAEGQTGHISCIPVRAYGFNNMVSFQYSLTWDASVMTFDHVQNLNLAGWLSTDFNGNMPGRLLVGWADIDGLPRTKANGAMLYEACFNVIGLVGSSTDITPGGEGFPPGSGSAEAYNNSFQNVYSAAANVPGLLEVTLAAGVTDAGQLTDGSFQLSPNPTSASAQVSLKSKVSGSAKLLVTDASGRTVLEQKIPVKAGENQFEIPAKVLNAKGMYQVSLQTEQGVSSQMLSVQ